MFYDADDYKHKCFRLVVFVAKVFLFIFTERKSFYKCHEKKLKTMKKKKTKINFINSLFNKDSQTKNKNFVL